MNTVRSEGDRNLNFMQGDHGISQRDHGSVVHIGSLNVYGDTPSRGLKDWPAIPPCPCHGEMRGMVTPLLDAIGQVSTDSFIAFDLDENTIYLSENICRTVGATWSDLDSLATLTDFVEFTAGKYEGVIIREAFDAVIETLESQYFDAMAVSGVRFKCVAAPVEDFGRLLAVVMRATPLGSL